MAATRWAGAAVAATEDRGPLGALLRAAVALPVLVVPVDSAAAEVGEIGLSVLAYRERSPGMKVTEPVLWMTLPFAQGWELRASALVDIVTGASPDGVSNVSGQPVQSFTGASVSDRRYAGDVKLSKRFGDIVLSASRAASDEEDYTSRAFGLEAKADLPNRTTTLVAAYGKSNDRVGSADDPSLDERRDTKEYLLGVTQVLSPLAVVQSNLQWSRGRGWYDDPYRFTRTFYPDAPPAFVPDHRPDARDAIAWLTRLRLHFPATAATLMVDYRYYRDDWAVRAHALEAAWSQDLGEGWSLRPALRWYWQSAANFYSPVVPRPAAEFQSSDQRLAAFGGLSPSLRLAWRDPAGIAAEATAGYYHNAANLRPGGGTPTFETLRAAYFLFTVSREF